MVSTISLTNKAGETGKWQYTYDDNGNIATVKTTTSAGSNTITYTYDTAGQLIREDNPAEYSTTVWTYDNAGNILSEKLYMYTTGTPSELMKTNSYTYGNANWGDLLTKYNGQTISYDTIGNPLTYNNGTAWTFTWEHGRQLATMSDGTSTWTNTYNSDGLRTSRTDGTTTYTYYYEEGRLSAIKRNDLNMWIIYDENGPVTLKYGVGTFHYVTNLQGDVVAIVGADGRKLVEYTYDAWGKVTSITGDYAYNLGIHNPILYRGYIYDHETGFYYCQSRYYDPETGRFLNADALVSTGQGMLGNNMFAYCCNNPVMYVDNTGNICKLIPLIPEKIEEYLTDSNSYGAAISGAAILTSAVIASSISAIKSAPRPANIGIGTYAKLQAADIAYLQGADRIASTTLNFLAFGAVAIDVYYGVEQNISNGASIGKIAYDATVDVVVTGGTIFTAGALGAKIGAAVGSVVPGAGNVIGGVAGFVISVAIYVTTDMIDYNGKTGREWLKGVVG